MERTISINLKGVFFTLQAAANRMIVQGRGGRLIALASIMAEWGSAGTPAYCASKGGVKQLVKCFAIACGRYGITCNGIGPGFIETAMTQMLSDDPMLAAYLVDRTPVGRIGQPIDVATAAAFLASDEASFVNGTTFFPFDRGYEAYPECQKHIRKLPSDYLKSNFYYDTVNFDLKALQFAIDFAGVDHLVAGSDYPHLIGSMEKMVSSINQLSVMPAEKQRILGGNAARLLGSRTSSPRARPG